MVAAKAYDSYNIDLALSGLRIHTPHTIRDVKWEEIRRRRHTHTHTISLSLLEPC